MHAARGQWIADQKDLQRMAMQTIPTNGLQNRIGQHKENAMKFSSMSIDRLLVCAQSL